MDQAGTGHHDAPHTDQTPYVEGWPAELFQDDVAWQHTHGIGQKENCQRDIVLAACKSQVLDQALDLGVANVGTVDMSDQVEDGQHRDEA